MLLGEKYIIRRLVPGDGDLMGKVSLFRLMLYHVLLV